MAKKNSTTKLFVLDTNVLMHDQLLSNYGQKK